MHHSPAGGQAAPVPLPEKVRHPDPSLPAPLIDVAHGGDPGPVAVPVHVKHSLERVLMHQADVSLIKKGVLGLTNNFSVFVGCSMNLHNGKSPLYFHDDSKVFVWFISFISILKISLASLSQCTVRGAFPRFSLGKWKFISHLSCNLPQLHNAQFSCMASLVSSLVPSDAVIMVAWSLGPGFTELELHYSR